MISAFFLAIAMFLGLGSSAPAEAAEPVAPAGTLAVCEYEDSANCFWDATQSGNGLGKSFVDVDGEVYFECEAEDTKNCFWDASKQGNGEGRSFTDVNGVALFWDEVGTDAGAWDTFDALGESAALVDGGQVTYSGLYSGQDVADNQIEAGGYLFTVS